MATRTTSKQRSEFGTRLVQSRKRAGLTQVQLARALGMGQSSMAAAEYVNNSSLKSTQIATILGVNPLWLSTGQGSWDDAVGTWQPAEPAARRPTVLSAGAHSRNLWDEAIKERSPPGPYINPLALTLSPLACELGAMLDLISDRVDRAVAHGRATQQILAVLTNNELVPGSVLAVRDQDVRPEPKGPATPVPPGRPANTPEQSAEASCTKPER